MTRSGDHGVRRLVERRDELVLAVHLHRDRPGGGDPGGGAEQASLDVGGGDGGKLGTVGGRVLPLLLARAATLNWQ